jgi:hypothetical protein
MIWILVTEAVMFATETLHGIFSGGQNASMYILA